MDEMKIKNLLAKITDWFEPISRVAGGRAKDPEWQVQAPPRRPIFWPVPDVSVVLLSSY